jgi:methylmalonyl-CoA mutase N-terminal domain/subunit
VGVNKYRPTEEHQVDVLCIDNKHVRESQIERLNRTLQNRDQKKVCSRTQQNQDQKRYVAG